MSIFSQIAIATISKEQLQSRVEQGALAYFVNNSNPQTGLTLDNAKNFGRPFLTNNIASMAATGFSLAVIANAAERGTINKDVAYQYAIKTLRFSRDHVPRWKGWFVHFVNWQSGENVWHSEYSTIDTALFMAGGLYAAQVFPNTEIAKIVQQLYTELDFLDLLTDGGRRPKKLTLSMGYTADFKYIPTQWDMYAEQGLLLILGLGHPTRPLPQASWLVFSRELRSDLMGFDQALFVHQYSFLFIDFRNFQDAFPNYFENSVRLSRKQRDIAQADRRYKTLREGFWGFSAGAAPGDNYEVANAVHYSSTACIGCVQASVMFNPDAVFADLAQWTESSYGGQIWGHYGLTDSIDLDKNWISQVVFGITVGPAYLSMANLEERTSLWRLFMKIPEIKKALKRAADTVRIKPAKD